MISKAVMEALMDMVPKENIHIEEPLANHTTFRVGGPAQFYVQPKASQVADVVRLCVQHRGTLYHSGQWQ